MADNPRLEDLRRRVQQDPSSIAFAQLAEEYRRGGQLQESIDVCRAGLTIHPGYLSARVTLGRALIELQQLEEAQIELETVLKSASENLAAIRGLAEIHHRRGSLADALAQYRAALTLARNDPDLEQTVSDLAAQLDPAKTVPGDASPFEESTSELFVKPLPEPPAAAAALERSSLPALMNFPTDAAGDTARTRAVRIVAALELWLQAINASRVERHA
jgi:tetratricopeptide (TPR) repeat protein